MSSQLNLEQLRKQAKERLREHRAGGREAKLADVQFELARELGFASWPKLKAYVERLSLEQPFRTDLGYYEGRADGIASVNDVSIAEARRDLAVRHGFASWGKLRRHVAAMRAGQEPPSPFVLAYRAVEDDDRQTLVGLLDSFPELVAQRGTNGNDLLGMAGDLAIVAVLLERGADPDRATTTAGRNCTPPPTGTTSSWPSFCSAPAHASTSRLAATAAHRWSPPCSGATGRSPSSSVASHAIYASPPASATSR